MQDLLLSLIGFILTILILVGVHEYGHYIVARWCDVRVIRFAIGFGRPLISYHNKHQTEFCVCAIPLGGYVKMLDSRESGTIADADKPYAFDYQPIWQRILIVFAGPFINLLLALLLLSLLSYGKVTEIRAVLGAVPIESVVYQAGLRSNDEVLQVNQQSVSSWNELIFQLVNASLSLSSVEIKTVSAGRAEFKLPVSAQMSDPDFDWQAYGLVAWQPKLKAVIDQVLDDQPAAQVGLQTGDEIVAFNQQPVTSWNELVQDIQNKPNQIVHLRVKRGTDLVDFNVLLGSHTSNPSRGFLGASVAVPTDAFSEVTRVSHNGAWQALVEGFAKTYSLLRLMLQSIAQMVTGNASLSQLGGPITIADQAGKSLAASSLSMNLAAFSSFLALLSISLAIINLLPIPPLDGGQIVLFISEAIMGKKPTESIQGILQKMGLALVLGLMIVALSNDFIRLFN